MHRRFHRGLGQRLCWRCAVAVDADCRPRRSRGYVSGQRSGGDVGELRKMGNDSVNFVSTVFAADLALVAAMVVAEDWPLKHSLRYVQLESCDPE